MDRVGADVRDADGLAAQCGCDNAVPKQAASLKALRPALRHAAQRAHVPRPMTRRWFVDILH